MEFTYFCIKLKVRNVQAYHELYTPLHGHPSGGPHQLHIYLSFVLFDSDHISRRFTLLEIVNIIDQ